MNYEIADIDIVFNDGETVHADVTVDTDHGFMTIRIDLISASEDCWCAHGRGAIYDAVLHDDEVVEEMLEAAAWMRDELKEKDMRSFDRKATAIACRFQLQMLAS